MIRNCQHCNKEFNVGSNNQIFCNKQCKRNFHKVIIMKTCLNCNEEFIRCAEHLKFCSNKCLTDYHTKFRYCEVCNTKFKPKHGSNATYCNDVCWEKIYKKVYICKVCNEIITKKKNCKYCSNECARIGKNTTHVCQYCNKEFIKTKGAIGKFCSKDCHNKSLFKPENWKYIQCKICNVEFYAPQHRKYCSQNCGLHAWASSETRGKRCIYNGIILRSTWELRVCNILDKLKEKGDIHKWEYEVDSINYISFDNEQHRYIIDFKVYRDEIDFYYIEVKGKLGEKDLFKFEAANDQEVDFYVWFYKEMKEQERLLNISKEDIKILLKNGIVKKSNSI